MRERGMSRLVVMTSAFVLAACAANVQTTQGTDEWSERVNKEWRPRTRMALMRFETFVKQRAGVSLKEEPSLILAATAEGLEATRNGNDNSIVIAMPQGATQQQLLYRATNLPVKAYVVALQNQMADGQGKRVPYWLREGMGFLITSESLNSEKDSQWGYYNYGLAKHALRDPKLDLRLADVIAGSEETRPQEGFAQYSFMLAWFLKEHLGDGFYPAWVCYFKAAAGSSFSHEGAFQQCFGQSEAEFLREASNRFEAIKAEVVARAASVPPASGFAAIGDIDRFPAKTSSGRAQYEYYLTRMRSPKALAASPRGAVGVAADGPTVMETALRFCRAEDPAGCRLYAVDDTVVFVPPSRSEEFVQVAMIHRSSNPWDWHHMLEERWLPLVRRVGESFNDAADALLGVRLQYPVQVYVGARPYELQSMLWRDFNMSVAESSRVISVSSGISNMRGKVAIVLAPDQKEEETRRQAITGTLHEVAHELQGELIQQARGFVPPTWFLEGSAEVMAYELAERMEAARIADFSAEVLKLRGLEDLRRLGFTASPAEVMAAKSAQWHEMSRLDSRNYSMAALMVLYLRDRLGTEFYPAMLRYLRAADTQGMIENRAFEQYFGVNAEAFPRDAEQWIRAEGAKRSRL